MPKVNASRMSAEMEGEFVVFLIGMRINKLWKVHKWLPVMLAMPKMLKELEAHPDSGFLGYNGLGRVIVQYWRSFEHLEAYARAKDRKHWPARVDFNRSVGRSRGDVGIWHETYLVKPGHYEAIYSGMPPYGLGKVGKLILATGKSEAARSRMTAGVQSSWRILPLPSSTSGTPSPARTTGRNPTPSAPLPRIRTYAMRADAPSTTAYSCFAA